MLGHQILPEDSARFGIQLEHAGIESQHVRVGDAGGSGRGAAGDRLHVGRQVLRSRRGSEARKKHRHQDWIAAAFLEQVGSHIYLPLDGGDGPRRFFKIPCVLTIRMSGTTDLAANVERGCLSYRMIVQHECDLASIRLYLIRSAKETELRPVH